MTEKYNLLNVIPYKAEHTITEMEGELAVIAFLRFKRLWVQKLFLPKKMSPYIRVRLEENGTVVWAAIDGKRSVNDIIGLLAGHFNQEEDYETRISTYIATLHKDGFIRYRVPVS